MFTTTEENFVKDLAELLVKYNLSVIHDADTDMDYYIDNTGDFIIPANTSLFISNKLLKEFRNKS